MISGGDFFSSGGGWSAMVLAAAFIAGQFIKYFGDRRAKPSGPMQDMASANTRLLSQLQDCQNELGRERKHADQLQEDNDQLRATLHRERTEHLDELAELRKQLEELNRRLTQAEARHRKEPMP